MKMNNNEIADLLWQTLYAAGIAVEVKPGMTVYSLAAWGVETNELHHLELDGENVWACDNYGDFIDTVDNVFVSKDAAEKEWNRRNGVNL